MKRFRDRTGRVLDAMVIVLAVPTVAIAATFGLREYEVAQSHALQSYRAALIRCDGLSGAARMACRADATASRRGADAALSQSARVADALARAQCDVLTGYAVDACADSGGPDKTILRAQPVTQVVDRGARRGNPAAERIVAR